MYRSHDCHAKYVHSTLIAVSPAPRICGLCVYNWPTYRMLLIPKNYMLTAQPQVAGPPPQTQPAAPKAAQASRKHYGNAWISRGRRADTRAISTTTLADYTRRSRVRRGGRAVWARRRQYLIKCLDEQREGVYAPALRKAHSSSGGGEKRNAIQIGPI